MSDAFRMTCPYGSSQTPAQPQPCCARVAHVEEGSPADRVGIEAGMVITEVEGRTVAMAGVPFGTQLLINGTVYTVEDLGTPYGHVDIYCGSHSEALAFGLQSADVYRLN